MRTDKQNGVDPEGAATVKLEMARSVVSSSFRHGGSSVYGPGHGNASHRISWLRTGECAGYCRPGGSVRFGLSRERSREAGALLRGFDHRADAANVHHGVGHRLSTHGHD